MIAVPTRVLTSSLWRASSSASWQQYLKERERKILCYCYGIGCHEKGLEEIGSEFNLTRERVRQIREKSIIKLRESGKIKILMKYLG